MRHQATLAVRGYVLTALSNRAVVGFEVNSAINKLLILTSPNSNRARVDDLFVQVQVLYLNGQVFRSLFH